MMFNTSTPETVRRSPEGKLDDMPPPNSDAGNHAGATQDSPDETCSFMDALCHPKIYQKAQMIQTQKPNVSNYATIGSIRSI